MVLPLLPYDVILFDVGGVILTNGWDHNERAEVQAQFSLDPVQFEMRHALCYNEWERGDITMDEYLLRTVFNESRAFTPDEFKAAIYAKSKLLPSGAFETLSHLNASKKYLLGALNNEARETNEFRFKHFGLDALFSVRLSSCYLGLRKPDQAIYRCALDVLSRPASRIVFIDDRAENVAAAQQAGMDGIQFSNAEELEVELKARNVID